MGEETKDGDETKVSEIGQIAITVSDVETVLPFYRDVLGLTFLFQPAPTLAFLDADGVRLMLTTPQGAGTVGKNSTLYFKVSRIEEAHAEILQRGATEERAPALAATMPDHQLWIGYLRDPDGNLVGLMEEKRDAAVEV
jgi:predicted enzyme related to lactoylglutathione lyase